MGQWRNVKNTVTLDVFDDLEEVCNTRLSNTFKKFVISHNSGQLYPYPYLFQNGWNKGILFTGVLPFYNTDLEETVYDIVNDLVKITDRPDCMPFGRSENNILCIYSDELILWVRNTDEFIPLHYKLNVFLCTLRTYEADT